MNNNSEYLYNPDFKILSIPDETCLSTTLDKVSPMSISAIDKNQLTIPGKKFVVCPFCKDSDGKYYTLLKPANYYQCPMNTGQSACTFRYPDAFYDLISTGKVKQKYGPGEFLFPVHTCEIQPTISCGPKLGPTWYCGCKDTRKKNWSMTANGMRPPIQYKNGQSSMEMPLSAEEIRLRDALFTKEYLKPLQSHSFQISQNESKSSGPKPLDLSKYQ